MNERRWSEVDSYFAKALIGADTALDEALAANSAAGLPSIDVSAPQGKLIHLLARMSGARKVLEIGTLGGYSTIWLARALPSDGRLVTLEYDPRHAEVARGNLAIAGLADRAEVVVEAALDTLPGVIDRADAPFDLVFANILLGPLVRMAAPMARLVARASFVVGVDTGLLHLAAALGVPLVAIFLGTEPGQHGPP